jgi:coenzyme F420 hydrogenase subunit beta
MFANRPASIAQVVEKRLCTGCGACAGIAPARFRMVDVPNAGLRPDVTDRADDPAAEALALSVCPGVGANASAAIRAVADDGMDAPCPREWGPVLEVWEGHATNPQIRWRGSSGGAVTALAAHALAAERVGGVVHVRQKDGSPLENETTISESPAEIVEAAGSRYAPASPCDRIDEIARRETPVVFIGKPCDVQALAAARSRDPRLERNIALSIAIFCAGTPSSNGTRALLERLGVPDDAKVTGIRYRGEGWPGEMHATYRLPDGTEGKTNGISYEEGWGRILQRHRQWRCHVCADHTGEFADISVGDPWDKPRGSEGAEGSSLIIVRTERGRTFLRHAIAAGALAASKRPRNAIAVAQPNLARTRRLLFGRLAGMRIAGMTPPAYPGWKLGWLWLRRTSLRDRAGSLLGTIKRVVARRLYLPEPGRESA